MDLTLLPAAISGLRAAADIAKGFHDLKTIADIQAKTIDLQNAILSAQASAMAAQSDQSAMVEEIRALKEEVARAKAWEEQKQRYSLTSPWQGAVVYALQEQRSYAEPPHWICTNCYQDGRKSILNPIKDGSWYKVVCPSCESVIQSPYRSAPAPQYVALHVASKE